MSKLNFKVKSIEEMTEQEFLAFVKTICTSAYSTSHQMDLAVQLFRDLSEHPDGSDLFFFPKGMIRDTPEGIVEKVKQWRAENGKPGFKEN